MPVSNQQRKLIASINLNQINVNLVTSSVENNTPEKNSSPLRGILMVMKATVASIQMYFHRYRMLTTCDAKVDHSETEGKVEHRKSVMPAANEKLINVPFMVSDGQFVDACIVFDLPSKDAGEPAAVDIQAQIGDMKLAVRKDMILVLCNPECLDQQRVAWDAIKDLHFAAALLFLDPMYLLDKENNVPYVLLRYEHTGDAIESIISPEKAHKRCLQSLSYLNVTRWNALVSSMIPKVATLCLRTSDIIMDVSTQSTIQLIVNYFVNKLYTNAMGLNEIKSLYSVLRLSSAADRRKTMKMKSAVDKKPGAEPLNITIGPVVMELMKQQDPISMIALKVLNISLSLPILDETLSKLISLMLSKMVPFYHIRSKANPVDVENKLVREVQRKYSIAQEVVESPIDTDVNDVLMEVQTPVQPPQIDMTPAPTMTKENVGLKGARMLSTFLPPSDAPQHSWCVCDHMKFEVRGQYYLANRKKIPSSTPMYQPIGVDVFWTPQRLDNIVAHLDVMPDIGGITTNHPSVPPVLVRYLSDIFV